MVSQFLNKNHKYQVVNVYTDEDTDEEYVILKEIDSITYPTRIATKADYLGKGE